VPPGVRGGEKRAKSVLVGKKRENGKTQTPPTKTQRLECKAATPRIPMAGSGTAAGIGSATDKPRTKG